MRRIPARSAVHVQKVHACTCNAMWRLELAVQLHYWSSFVIDTLCVYSNAVIKCTHGDYWAEFVAHDTDPELEAFVMLMICKRILCATSCSSCTFSSSGALNSDICRDITSWKSLDHVHRKTQKNTFFLLTVYEQCRVQLTVPLDSKQICPQGECTARASDYWAAHGKEVRLSCMGVVIWGWPAGCGAAQRWSKSNDVIWPMGGPGWQYLERTLCFH